MVVAVPDPGFTPVMATWISALVVSPLMRVEEQVHVLAQLVPLVAPNATVLDTLLARLVRVAPGVDLDRLEQASTKADTVEPAGGAEFGEYGIA